jgi:hypothetical protein
MRIPGDAYRRGTSRRGTSIAETRSEHRLAGWRVGSLPLLFGAYSLPPPPRPQSLPPTESFLLTSAFPPGQSLLVPAPLSPFLPPSPSSSHPPSPRANLRLPPSFRPEAQAGQAGRDLNLERLPHVTERLNLERLPHALSMSQSVCLMLRACETL